MTGAVNRINTWCVSGMRFPRQLFSNMELDSVEADMPTDYLGRCASARPLTATAASC